MKWLLNLFGGGLAGEIRGALQDRLNAQNETARIAADERLAFLQAKMVSQQIGGRWITFIQVGFALPFVLYNAKLIIWDKMMGMGITDPLSQPLYDLQTTIIGFFFVSTTVGAVLRR